MLGKTAERLRRIKNRAGLAARAFAAEPLAP